MPLLAPLLLTVALEEAFALLWGLRGWRQLLLVALVNGLTNPPVNFFYHLLRTVPRMAPAALTVCLEAAAVLVEWLCYRRLDRTVPRPFLLALLANLFSYSMGCLLQVII